MHVLVLKMWDTSKSTVLMLWCFKSNFRTANELVECNCKQSCKPSMMEHTDESIHECDTAWFVKYLPFDKPPCTLKFDSPGEKAMLTKRALSVWLEIFIDACDQSCLWSPQHSLYCQTSALPILLLAIMLFNWYVALCAMKLRELPTDGKSLSGKNKLCS